MFGIDLVNSRKLYVGQQQRKSTVQLFYIVEFSVGTELVLQSFVMVWGQNGRGGCLRVSQVFKFVFLFQFFGQLFFFSIRREVDFLQRVRVSVWFGGQQIWLMVYIRGMGEYICFFIVVRFLNFWQLVFYFLGRRLENFFGKFD